MLYILGLVSIIVAKEAHVITSDTALAVFTLLTIGEVISLFFDKIEPE